MADRSLLDERAARALLPAAAGWAHDGAALRKSYAFADYAAGVAFAVRVAMAAEQHEHHPEMRVAYGRVEVVWSTHDAGGVTALDVAMATRTDALAGG